MLDTHARKYVQPFIETTASRLLKMGLTANQVTMMSFLVGLSSGILFYLNYVVAAVIVLWMSGFLDAVDGTMARKTNVSPWGTVMDVTFDRIVEISVILGIAFKYPHVQWALLLLSVSIIFSITVFLTVGAVSNKKGMKSFYYQPGLAERTEGFLLFSLMMLLPNYVLFITLLFFVVELFTGLQRLNEARQLLH
ncbi:Inner membrane protein YnjF [Anoxybacillus thermarum]|uniref:Inner membrane protein YnjF n=1 Tax=Anoxybacillus thermarum TaxID=404937 RepID=A0A0D0RRI0_9BACL|nr:CDP-alcohol phosphatidyltransferase family protein [Anoxybacillus thermarum]KIQ94282.1 Inner membrane protein YnjF [Anoxybacillus thermarum]